MSFDQIIDRRDTGCAKWDRMEALFGVSPDDGLAMWVADMDFRPPAAVTGAVRAMAEHGIYGYPGDDASYRAAIAWWMETRHGWAPDPDHILTTHGLVNAVGLCLDAYTAPGDGVCVMAPVYHAFGRVIRAAGRRYAELEMPIVDGRYTLATDDWDAAMTGDERIFLLCSPHNPGGRVWTRDELAAIAAFARRHDLILVSDEIHHDIVFPGHRHIPMAAMDGIADRLVMLTSASKTFNIAGSHTGNAIIADEALRDRFKGRLAALGLSPNAFGLKMVEAAYSPEGAAWTDDLVAYLDTNRRAFDDGVNAIPGLRSMPLEATYLAWVDFAGTGLEQDDLKARVAGHAGIAASPGPSFGTGGEGFLRFNLGMPRARIEDAVARLQAAFRDLQ